jgi:hypothetical protein
MSLKSDSFPNYLWDPNNKNLTIVRTNKPFLCPTMATPAKFDSLEEAQRFLREQDIKGTIGKLVSSQFNPE